MVARIDEARNAGDTVGGIFEVVATGLPIGLGSHVHWDRRLDAALAGAIMSIPIVKGVEFGLGFEQTRRFGSAVMDVIEGRNDAGEWGRSTNNAGGLEGGISNGQPIVIRGAVKPISTLPRPLPSADLITGQPVEKGHYERSDISVVPATGVVAEAMVCLTLADFLLEKFGGDSVGETAQNLAHYRARSATGNPAAAASVRRRARQSLASASSAMDLVLVGLPGSGKSAVGRRLAQRHHATFVDLDERVERLAGKLVPAIFAEEGEAGFRRYEHEAVLSLGPADADPELRRVIATGGGSIIDPRNRWLLYRGRFPVWLDGSPEILASRLARSVHVRPLVAGPRPRRDVAPAGRRSASLLRPGPPDQWHGQRRGHHARHGGSPR